MAEEAVSNQTVQREVDRLAKEVNFLRKQTEGLTGKPAPDAVHDGVPKPQGAATEEDFQQTFNRLRREVVDLAIALNRLRSTDESGPASSRRSRTVTATSSAYTIKADRLSRNRSVTIRNVGDDLVVNAQLTVNGKKRWFTTGDILKEVLDAEMTDREKAIALWSFLKDNRYHDQPAHNDIETHDPVRYLNVYGYGFCDDSATNFMALAEAAGLNARVWGLSGHVVPEAFFDGGWHMLDPDGEIYYLDDDSENISSVKTLEQRPDIIRRYPSPFYTDADMLVRIYTTTDDNRISEWYRDKSETVHRMDYVLRPGESISRSWDNRGLYFSSRYLGEPRRYGNGRFTFEPVFSDSLYRKGTQVKSLKTQRMDGAVALSVAASAKRGTIVVPIASPYPVLSGKVLVSGEVGTGGRLDIQFSEDGGEWSSILTESDAGTFETEVSTRPFLRNGHGSPVYSYRLKFALRRPCRIDHVSIESDFQHAPQALPELIAGSNRVMYSDETKGGRAVQIIFRFDEEKDDS
jgi:hypothetical protein